MLYYQTSYMDITEHSLHRQKFVAKEEGTIVQLMTSLSTCEYNSLCHKYN